MDGVTTHRRRRRRAGVERKKYRYSHVLLALIHTETAAPRERARTIEPRTRMPALLPAVAHQGGAGRGGSGQLHWARHTGALAVGEERALVWRAEERTDPEANVVQWIIFDVLPPRAVPRQGNTH